jgi:hypothetical protein
MSGMENMFRIGDKIIKEEHFGTISRMLSWNLNVKNIWIKEKFKNINFALGFEEEELMFYAIGIIVVANITR